jgi:hypothetical protein
VEIIAQQKLENTGSILRGILYVESLGNTDLKN